MTLAYALNIFHCLACSFPTISISMSQELMNLTRSNYDLHIMVLNSTYLTDELSFLMKIFEIRHEYNKGVWVLYISNGRISQNKEFISNLKFDFDNDFLIIEEESDIFHIWDAYRIGKSLENNIIYTKIGFKEKDQLNITWNSKSKWDRRKDLQVSSKFN